MKNNKGKLIGKICLILSCGLLLLFSTVAYGADYVFTYKGVSANTLEKCQV